MNLCPWTVAFTSISQFVLLLSCRCGNGWRGLELGISLPPWGRLEWAGAEYFLFFRYVRFWWNCFSWGQASLRIECSGILQSGSFFPSCWKLGAFLPYSPWGTGRTTRGKTHKKVVISLWQAPPKIFSSQSCLSRLNLQQSVNYSLDFFYLSIGSWGSFCSGVSPPVSCDSLYLFVSLILG